MEILFSVGDVLRLLNVPYRNLHYLFESGRLNPMDFRTIGGKRIYTESDIEKIKEAFGTIKKSPRC